MSTIKFDYSAQPAEPKKERAPSVVQRFLSKRKSIGLAVISIIIILWASGAVNSDELIEKEASPAKEVQTIEISLPARNT